MEILEIMFKNIFLFPSSLQNSEPQCRHTAPGVCRTYAVFLLVLMACGAWDAHIPKHSAREAVYVALGRQVCKSKTGGMTSLYSQFY